MILSELIGALQSRTASRAMSDLLALLQQWPKNDDTVDDLYHAVEQHLRTAWKGSSDELEMVNRLWARFRGQCISGRGGMTINERLYCFGLFDAWDAARSEEERAAIRRKIV